MTGRDLDAGLRYAQARFWGWRYETVVRWHGEDHMTAERPDPLAPLPPRAPRDSSPASQLSGVCATVGGTGQCVNANQGALVGAHTVRVPVADPPEQRTSSWQAASTIVPIVPPEHRPRRPRRLSRCHVLWEVESWTRIPPKDPALLWHIRGDLWAVLATWDLTELERLVLAQ